MFVIDEETDAAQSSSAIIPLWLESCYSLLGIFIGMGLISFISVHYDMYLLIPSFASSALMLFVSYNNPLAQPRNVLGGHLMSALAGMFTNYFWANEWWAITLAVVLAALLMILTKTLHPPGGGTAIVAHLGAVGHSSYYLLIPVLASSVIIILVALIVNNSVSSRKYPMFWW